MADGTFVIANPIAAAQHSRPWFDRVGNPLDWALGNRCAFLAGLCLFFTIWVDAIARYAATFPKSAPFLSHIALPILSHIEERVFVTGWIVLGCLGIVIARRGLRGSRLVGHLVGQLYVLHILAVGYFVGLFTTMYFGTTMVSGFALGMVLLDGGIVIPALFVGTILIVAITAAEQLHAIPYAPLMATPPYAYGHLSAWWLMTFGGIDIAILAIVLATVYFILERWRAREKDLVRAHTFIKRYVPAQLSAHIVGGAIATDAPQRRKLTVVFSDMDGFTELADHAEPEDLSTILNSYFSSMTEVADRYGGTVDKFMGDGMMVFFGAPEFTDDRDHAFRAVAMAAEMQRVMQELNVKWSANGTIERPLHIRIGINTGVSAVGNLGSHERVTYTAIGRHVNLAQRLQTRCKPGKILLAHSTWALTQDRVKCESCGEVSVKGVSHPIPAYEVV